MKNILNIDATNDCECSLVSSFDDGTNALFLEIKSDLSLNPKIVQTIDGYTGTIKITSSPFIYEIPVSVHTNAKVISFYISDDNHTGEKFTINKPQGSFEGNLIIRQVSNFEYTLTDIVKDECVKQSDIVNRLTSTARDKVLSAYQGQLLNNNKVNKSAIKNNLTTTVSGYVLDARQGKELKSLIDEKIMVQTLTVTGLGSDYIFLPTPAGYTIITAVNPNWGYEYCVRGVSAYLGGDTILFFAQAVPTNVSFTVNVYWYKTS